MNHRIRQAFVALAASAVVAAGGTAIASAATSTPTPSPSTKSTTAKEGKPIATPRAHGSKAHDSANCPNM